MDERSLADVDDSQEVPLLWCSDSRCAKMNHPNPPQKSVCRSPKQRLAFEAHAKAECAWCRWWAARQAGDEQAAVRARRLMLRHQAIAWCLDPLRAGHRDAP